MPTPAITKKKAKKNITTMYIDTNLYRKLKVYAARVETSVSEVMEAAIAQYLEGGIAK